MASKNTNLTNALELAKKYDYANVENEFDLLLSSNQNDVLSLYYRGCTRIHFNKYQLATVNFDAAISSLNLSTKHEVQALYQHSYIQCLNRAKENNSNDLIHKTHFSIGTVHATLGKNEQTLRHFNHAIKNSRDSTEDTSKIYYLHRGRACAFCADFNGARNDLNIVIKESNDPLLRGCAHNELDQHDQAIKEFDLWFESDLRINNISRPLVETLDDHA
ncbi:unnamed protein product [Rotaria magnacalcarata]|uniref:Uncharacterized protein n=1 Tax=Rotaria magnacalcarata TaxID=392030 RepID=A0A816W6J6_9BILA|nr:unnamed protein product [Rotaria magnacalcarata]